MQFRQGERYIEQGCIKKKVFTLRKGFIVAITESVSENNFSGEAAHNPFIIVLSFFCNERAGIRVIGCKRAASKSTEVNKLFQVDSRGLIPTALANR